VPELPEVETIRLSLEPILKNQTILSVKVFETRLRWKVNPKILTEWLEGSRVLSIDRRAKYLLWKLDNDATVIIHLGMSGRLGLFHADEPLESHTHIIFSLSGSREIRYRDPRRFGYVDVIPPQQLLTHPRLRNLGPEPLSNDFNRDYFAAKLSGTSRTIKNVLMDASIVAGLGNIYANEALFMAGIRPDRRAKDLPAGETENLVRAVKTVLQKAIERGGTTLKDFRNASGEPGFFSIELAVYGREGESCNICGAPIERIKINGRSSYFCPHCQK